MRSGLSVLALVLSLVLGGCGGAIKPETMKVFAGPATPLDGAQGLVWRLRLGARGDAIGFGHDGDLGQYFAVYPGRKMVAIRLRQWKDSPDRGKPEHSFGAFLALVEAAD